MSNNNTPPKPEMCDKCAALVDDSNLHWALCGGVRIGHIEHPLEWKLCHKNEKERANQRAFELQKMAAMARCLHRVLEWSPAEYPPDILRQQDNIRVALGIKRLKAEQ